MTESNGRKGLLSNTSLEVINKHRRYGDIHTVAQKTNKSRAHLRNVLSGISEDVDVVTAFLKVIQNRMQKTHDAEELAKKLNENLS